jgi:pentatricopeptide repeat protein
MQRQGVVPNVITFNALISACEKGQEPERALELFEAMQRQGVVPVSSQLFWHNCFGTNSLLTLARGWPAGRCKRHR